MRSILIVLGIALLAVIIGITTQKSKQLSPNPQDLAEYRRNSAGAQAMKTGAAASAPANETFNPPREGVKTVVMTVEGRGDVTLELYPKAAPKTVARFLELIKSGFYNGIQFHRVVPDFVVQAGDPTTKGVPPGRLAAMTPEDVEGAGFGKNGSGKSMEFEYNKLQHVEGTIAIALMEPRSDTGDSQFFINLVSNHRLDGDYCVFGKVAQGMDVVKKIQRGDRIARFVVK